MKKLMFILFVSGLLFLTSCEKLCPDVPSPKGTPDDISWYSGTGGYESVTYTYYCWNGKYRAITWTRTEKCGSWEKTEFTSSCIKK
jgi:hypothetical protein